MEKFKYVECAECGTVHYVIDKQQAKTIDDSGALFYEFSKRNVKCCANCGSSKRFLVVSDVYASEYSYSDTIPPILLMDEEINRNTADGSK